MKKTIKCPFAFALTLTVGMSSMAFGQKVDDQEKRTEEEAQVQLCEDYTAWCMPGADQESLVYCDPDHPCFPELTESFACMASVGICWPHYQDKPCLKVEHAAKVCMDLHAVCGDGFVSGDEECDFGVENRDCTPECKWACEVRPCHEDTQEVPHETEALCEAFTAWCGHGWNHAPFELYCDASLPCHQEGKEVLNCMYENALCWHFDGDFGPLCFSEGEAFEACMDLYSVCGDGFVSGEEQCEEDDPFFACEDCQYMCGDEPCGKCSNGIVEYLEECDDGNWELGDGCNPFCEIEICGNNQIDPPHENCDDGNNVDGDGCSSICLKEPIPQ